MLFFFVCTPKKYDLKEGAVAHETIWATRDVVDEVRTQERRETAAAKTEIQYVYSNVKQDVMASLESAFDELRSIQRYGEQLRTSEPGRGDRFTEDEIEFATIEYLVLPSDLIMAASPTLSILKICPRAVILR